MKRNVADYDEALEILSELARGGDVRAAVALAGHLRKEHGSEEPKERGRILKLAEKRVS